MRHGVKGRPHAHALCCAGTCDWDARATGVGTDGGESAKQQEMHTVTVVNNGNGNGNAASTSQPSNSPAVTTMGLPFPVSVDPTTIDTAPAWPPIAAPVARVMPPDAPVVVVPVESVMPPEEPAVTDAPVKIDTAP